MKFNQPLDQILGQQSKVRILRLFSSNQGQFTIREIARRIDLTVPNVSRALKELEEQAIVISQQAGRSILYSLNQNHYLVSTAILPMFKKESEAMKDLTGLLKRSFGHKIVSSILFGSLARKEEKGISDIDMLFIVNDGVDTQKIEEGILEKNPEIVHLFGNSISPLVMTISEFISRFKKKDRLLGKILKEGEVLDGELISDLLSHA